MYNIKLFGGVLGHTDSPLNRQATAGMMNNLRQCENKYNTDCAYEAGLRAGRKEKSVSEMSYWEMVAWSKKE